MLSILYSFSDLSTRQVWVPLSYLKNLDSIKGDGPLAGELEEDHQDQDHNEGVEHAAVQDVQEPAQAQNYEDKDHMKG